VVSDDKSLYYAISGDKPPGGIVHAFLPDRSLSEPVSDGGNRAQRLVVMEYIGS